MVEMIPKNLRDALGAFYLYRASIILSNREGRIKDRRAYPVKTLCLMLMVKDCIGRAVRHDKCHACPIVL